MQERDLEWLLLISASWVVKYSQENHVSILRNVSGILILVFIFQWFKSGMGWGNTEVAVFEFIGLQVIKVFGNSVIKFSDSVSLSAK